MDRKLILGLGIVSVLVIAGVFSLRLNDASEAQENLGDTTENADLQACRDIRENACLTSDTLSESDYPESCFDDGEHVLEAPYQCPS